MRGRDTLKIVWVRRRMIYMRMNDKTKYAIYKLIFPFGYKSRSSYCPLGVCLMREQFKGETYISARMCPFMGYNNNMAPVYWPDIYGKFISVYAATHTVGSQATCWLWLWAILWGARSIKYWGSFIFLFLFNYGLHVLPVGLSLCLCQIKLLG